MSVPVGWANLGYGGFEVEHLWQALLLLFLAVAAPLAHAHADSTVTYTYDALGRLVRSVSSGTSTADTTYTKLRCG